MKYPSVVKRSTLTAIVAVIAAVTASAAAASPVVYQPSRGTPVGRVVLFHSLNQDKYEFDNVPEFTDLLARLRNQGWQVVVPDLPYDGPNEIQDIHNALAPDHGAAFVANWNTTYIGILDWANTHYGTMPTVVGGVSWGGWSALEAACMYPGKIVGWFAEIPVAVPAVLSSFADTQPTALSLSNCASYLSQHPGFLSWGALDTTTGWQNTVNLGRAINDINGSATTVGISGLGHDITPGMDRALESWIEGIPT